VAARRAHGGASVGVGVGVGVAMDAWSRCAWIVSEGYGGGETRPPPGEKKVLKE
jgi:hypothetical protein